MTVPVTQPTTRERHSMTERMLGASKLDAAIYEEVEADSSATAQAAGVVVIVALARGIGGLEGGAPGLVFAIVASVLGWLVWAGVTYLIGDKILRGTATWGELLRTLGFAQTPGILGILGIIPLVGGLIAVVVTVWVLIAGIVAIRQALDFGTGKAILTALLGWLAIAIPTAILALAGVGR